MDKKTIRISTGEEIPIPDSLAKEIDELTKDIADTMHAAFSSRKKSITTPVGKKIDVPDISAKDISQFIHEDKMLCDGNIIIFVDDIIDTIFNANIYDLLRIHPCHILSIDTLAGAEWEESVYNGKDILGSIVDMNGCCSFCAIHKRDLLAILSIADIASIDKMLDTYYKIMDNSNITRESLNFGGQYGAIFEIPKFKGTITNSTMPSKIDPDDDALYISIDGINTETNQPIHLVIKDYDDDTDM